MSHVSRAYLAQLDCRLGANKQISSDGASRDSSSYSVQKNSMSIFNTHIPSFGLIHVSRTYLI